ncbi:MAG: biotin/lipoyl-binding protein, partial [Verrucomicrobiae bacterium]|nr:biotin/lipoyl-binding protein [Verrucomicrobiae bacterium]
QSRAPKNAVTRRKGDSKDPLQAVAPMPGMVTEVAVGVGHRVKAGDPLVTLEAMKMLTTISAAEDGVVTEVIVRVGEAVETDDLLLCLEK